METSDYVIGICKRIAANPHCDKTMAEVLDSLVRYGFAYAYNDEYNDVPAWLAIAAYEIGE